MAIYKPNNFYPHLQEIDLTNENTFSCQVNTDGAMVSAARLTISSEDNILVYENLYQFVDADGEKDPIENKGFMELPMDPYKIDKSNISFDLIDKTLTPIFYKYGINEQGKVIYYDEYGKNGEKIGFSTREEAMAAQVYDEDKTTILYNTVVEDGVLDNYNKKIVIINNIDFITLHPEVPYDIRKDYCPYNFYNVRLKDSFCFGLKFVNSLDENDTKIYPFQKLNYEKTDNGYNVKIIYNTELLVDDISNYDCYVVLLNGKDYTWDVKMYEHLFSEYVDKGTLVTDGYITGSTKTVFWWDDTKQTGDTILNRKEIKEDYYVEINATEDNSDIFKEQLKLGRNTKGILSISNNLTDEKINNKELLNNVNIDGKVTNDFMVELLTEKNSTSISSNTKNGLLPYYKYYYSDSGQRKIDKATPTWKFQDNNSLMSGTSPGFYDERCITYYDYDNDNRYSWKGDTENYIYRKHIRSILNSEIWIEINNLNISIKQDEYGYKEFVIDDSNALKGNKAKRVIRSGFGLLSGNNNSNYDITYNYYNNGGDDYRYGWLFYSIDGEKKNKHGESFTGISCEILNQDFYRYPFLFSSAVTKVVGFPKSILINFMNSCTEGSKAYLKIKDIIDFYDKKYLTVNVSGVAYYAKVFTPRPYSPYFYQISLEPFKNTYSKTMGYVLDDCMKYPTIYNVNSGFSRDITEYEKPIYPNTEIGEIIIPEDDFSFSDNSECITMEDDIFVFENSDDYATALCIPSDYIMYDSNKMFKYFNAIYPPIKIFDSEDNKGILRYKIVARGTTTNAMENTLYQEVDVKSGCKYRVSGILHISGDDLDSKEFSKHANMFSCKVYEKSNSSVYVDFIINNFINYKKYIVEEKRYYDFSFEITIPTTFDIPVLKLQIAMSVNDNIDDVNIRSVDVYNLSLVEGNANNEIKLFLDEKTVDINDYKENIFIHTIVPIAGDYYGKIIGEHDFKLKKYVKSLNYFEFEDSTIQDLFIHYLNNQIEKIEYYIFYKQREKITWITEKLGFEKNINKIEVENDFEVNLKDNTPIELYGGSNENTYYSFFGVRDSDINVEDIYVRFPGYTGKDFNGNYVNDNLNYYDGEGLAEEIFEQGSETPLSLSSSVGLQGYFYQRGNYYIENATTPTSWKEEDFQPISLYGKNVPRDVFEEKEAGLYGYIDNFNILLQDTKTCFKSVNIRNLTDEQIPSLGIYDTSGAVLLRIYAKYKTINNEVKISLNQETNQWEMELVSGSWYYDPNRAYNGSSDTIELNTIMWKWDDTRIKIVFEYTNRYVSNSYNGKFNINFGKTYNENINCPNNYYLNKISSPSTYCKLFKVTSYDYETGEFVIAGGLEREILNTDKYEVWQRTVNESMTNEYNITEVAYQYTRLYPPSENYKDIAYVGDTKILKDGIKIMNNTNNRVFIQPNINFYSDEYNYPYLILDNYAQRLEFPYNYIVYDDGFTIQDRTIETLDGSQWLLSYNTNGNTEITPGFAYKLYIDACKSTPSNWFYGRNIAHITMRIGEYNYIQNQLTKGYVKPIDFSNYKETFNDITNKKIGNNCLVQCVDAYFMATYDQLSVPIKRYRYKFYDSSMNLIKDSEYIYDNYISYGIRGLRNEEIYLLHFEMEDQLGYVYTYEEKIIVKYIEYNTNLIQLQLTNKESQGCIVGDFVTMVEAESKKDENGNIQDIIAKRDTYDEDGNIIKKGSIIKDGTIYAELCRQEDFKNKLNCSALDDIFVYRRNKEKLLSFVCKINLSKDQIITGREDHEHRYGFIDYGVYNNEYYDYVVILKQNDLTTDSHLGNMEYTYSESRCKTSFNGWILVDIEKDDASNSYYVSDQVWNFKYNLESQDLTQNTSVSKWDTLGKYANVYIGQKNYISSGLTCLLGDVGTYYTYNGNTFKENFGYFEQPFESVNYDDIHDIISNEVLTNNIDKYLSWKTFNNNGNPKLLKDYKGNMWIVQIMENPTVKNADNSQEQVYTISFNWVEIMDWRKYPILGKNISFDREEAANTEMMDILEAWDYKYDSEDIFYNLSKVRDDYGFNNVTTYETPLLVSGRITLKNNAVTGILNDSYLGDSLLESEKQFLSSMTDDEVENKYNSQNTFISPFKTKQLDNSYAYSSGLEYLDFEQSLLYENNSIDFLCCRMNTLKGININLTDAIKTARYAFAGTSIATDAQYQIQINTNNYINTYGMLDDLQGNGVVTVKWGTLADDPDLVTYAELYERYWNNDNIILDCKLDFNINDWMTGPIKDEIGNMDGIDYTKKIVLNSYEGSLTSVYIPKFYKDSDGVIYLIELSENFNI